MPYAYGDDLTARYDVDLVGDCATDDRSTLARSEVPVHPNVLEALSEASGRVNAALRSGGRYEVEQLASLTGDDAAFLKSLVCDLAMVRLAMRRGENALGDMLQKIMDRAEGYLDKLRKGENVFDLPEVIDATIVDTDGPTAVDLQNRNGLPERMSRYFPDPITRLPSKQGGGA